MFLDDVIQRIVEEVRQEWYEVRLNKAKDLGQDRMSEEIALDAFGHCLHTLPRGLIYQYAPREDRDLLLHRFVIAFEILGIAYKEHGDGNFRIHPFLHYAWSLVVKLLRTTKVKYDLEDTLEVADIFERKYVTAFR